MIIQKYTPTANTLPHTPEELKTILLIVSEATGIKEEEIKLKKRKKEIVLAKQIYCYLSDKYTKNALKNIAKAVNYRDHTDVIYSIGALMELIDVGYEDVTEPLKVAEEIVSRIYSVKKKKYAA